jgi:hypothetical protein
MVMSTVGVERCCSASAENRIHPTQAAIAETVLIDQHYIEIISSTLVNTTLHTY